MWYLIVSIPDLCTLTYFVTIKNRCTHSIEEKSEMVPVSMNLFCFVFLKNDTLQLYLLDIFGNVLLSMEYIFE